uniref:Putative secreted peptide n=1 Tax=Rhipicephalus pulchellus TaxID=72859 RepID=L7MAI8_RHIPC
MLLCLSMLLSIPCSIHVRQSCFCRCVAKMYTHLKVCFSSFRALSSLMYVFFFSEEKKKDGHFRGRQWSLKKLVLSGCVHTNTQKT